ncbi:MAG: hypothetical protein ACC628_17795, partial [Pirellulaceae bacterium]
MRQFKWIEWNLEKIDAHALSAEEAEAAFDRVFRLQQRKDGSYQIFAETPSGFGLGCAKVGVDTPFVVRADR